MIMNTFSLCKKRIKMMKFEKKRLDFIIINNNNFLFCNINYNKTIKKQSTQFIRGIFIYKKNHHLIRVCIIVKWGKNILRILKF